MPNSEKTPAETNTIVTVQPDPAANQGFVRTEMLEPVAPPGSERLYIAPSSRLPATWGLIAVLAIVFIAEIAFGIGPLMGPLQPSLATLSAFGGATQPQILEQGQWYLLLTMAFVHGSFFHLAANAVGLWLAGRILEPMVGGIKFLAVFFAGAIGGSLASIAFNPPNMVLVGASGAIMGLFGFALGSAFKIPAGLARNSLINRCVSVLVPSIGPALLPGQGAIGGMAIDYAAHAGGAIAGVVLAIIAGWVIRQSTPASLSTRRLSLGTVCVSALVLLVGAGFLVRDYSEHQYAQNLIPASEMPSTDALFAGRSAEFVSRYPLDPRGHLVQTLAYLLKADAASAEREARVAFDLVEKHPKAFTTDFRERPRIMLAFALLALGRKGEAIDVARPICGTALAPVAKADLKRRGACE